MKNKSLIITNIIILCCIIVGLVMFMFWGLGNKEGFFLEDMDLLQTETFDIFDIKEISSNLKDFDLVLEKSNNSKIKVEFYGKEKDKNSIKITNKSGNLKIEQIKKRMAIYFGFYAQNKRIVISVPESFLGTIDMKTISGDIDFSFLGELQKVNLNTISGDIAADYINIGDLNSTSGDIDLLKGNKINANTVSGDIEIGEVQDVALKSTSGEIHISDLNGGGDMNTVSGDITIKKFNINKNSNINAVGGDVDINLLNGAKVIASSRSGEKDIKSLDGEFELNIKTTSGDITVR